MRILKSFVIMFLIAASVWADGGSLYTRKGIGDIYFALNARRFALGGGGIALNSITDLSSLNPAGLYGLRTTRFEIGMYYNGLNLSNSSSDIRYSQVNLSGFTIALPIDTAQGLVLSAGMTPYSNVQYEVIKTSTDPIVGSYKSTYEGSGGLNKLYFGLTTKLPMGFALGASFEYYYGSIEYNAKLTIDNVEYKSGIFKNQNNFQGTGMNVGILTPDMSHIFGSKDITNFRLGLSVNYIFSMKRDSSEVSGSSDSTFISSSVNQDVKMPVRISAGAAVKLFNRYQVIADYFFQPFEKLTFDNVKPGMYQDLHRLSFGVEYTNPSPAKDSFWDRVALRLGCSYERSQYVINYTSISQYALHAGFSLPLGGSNTLDLALQYGTRGTTDHNLIKENFLNLNVGLSFGELWFQRIDR